MKMSKTIIASLLGLTLAAGVMAEEKTHQMITIEAKSGGPAEVSISNNGEVQIFTISEEALKDKDLLLSELSGASDEVQQHISQALLGLHSIQDLDIEIDHDSVHNKVWIQKGAEDAHAFSDKGNVAFVTVDDESTNDMKVIIKQGHGLHIDSAKNASFSAIKHLLKSSELSAEQLNTLQEILDSKR